MLQGHQTVLRVRHRRVKTRIPSGTVYGRASMGGLCTDCVNRIRD